MIEKFDVLVVGAGIIGAACAFECARAGMRVGMVESSVPGGAATAAGMGHIVAMDDSPAQLALSAYSRKLWRELRTQLPDEAEYEECGTVWIAADHEEMQEAAVRRETYANGNVASEILDERALYEAEPHLRAGLAGGLLVPNDGVLYPPRAAAYFIDEALRNKGRLIRGHRVVRACRGEVQLEDSTRLVASQIVVATGTDTSLCPWLNVQPRKGHLVITDRSPGMIRHQLVELGYMKSAHKLHADSVAFNIQPRRTGQLLIGSSRQYGDRTAQAEPTMVHQIMNRALEYMPVLRQLSAVRIWTGFRAATADKLPVIGPTADASIFLAMGFEGLGITNAPGAAKLMLHHLSGAAVDVDARPYLPQRLDAAEAACA